MFKNSGELVQWFYEEIRCGWYAVKETFNCSGEVLAGLLPWWGSPLSTSARETAAIAPSYLPYMLRYHLSQLGNE